MNLVAKEYVASQDPEDPGVLVLSMFAGAASQMGAALLVNPYDTVGVARRIHEALYMPKEERIERWNALMRTLRNSDLDGWFNSFLGALQACSLPVGQIARLSVA
jgi:trehalose 6-phosphate synthase